MKEVTSQVIEGIANELYHTYCAAVGWKAFNGDSLPDWKTFRNDPKKTAQATAWISTALNAVEIMRREHIFWGAGEHDCPKDLKAPNGQLHTLQCKICGCRNPRDRVCFSASR